MSLEQTQLTSAQARRLCEKIAGQVHDLAELLWELRERKGWLALGYANWNECCETEFKYSKRHANYLIEVQRVKEQVGENLPLPIKDSHAAALAKVPEEQRQPVLDWATEKADGAPLTAKSIREAAAEVLDAVPEDDEPEDEPGEDCDVAKRNGVELSAVPDEWDEVVAFVLKWMRKYEKSAAVVAARLENLAAKLRTEN